MACTPPVTAARSGLFNSNDVKTVIKQPTKVASEDEEITFDLF